jgi:preprotein translocase subunit SecB
MTEKTLHVAVQYTRQANMVTYVRPYANREGLSNDIGLAMVIEALPEPNHHRVEVHAQVAGRNAAGVLCFEASCIVEGIVAHAGLAGAELDDALRNIAAPSVFGTARSVLTSVCSGTGYGPVVLPPLSVEAVANLQPPKGTQAAIPQTS